MLRCGRYLFGALLGLLLSAAVAGAAEKTFTIAYDADPQTSDMQMTTEFYLIPLNCYDRLIECRTVKGQPQLVPGLAEKWDVSEDARVYTFHLRKRVRFHNGEELTAKDVVYTFDRMLDPKTKALNTDILDFVEGAQERMDGKATSTRGLKALDRYTVRITLKAPFVPFLAIMASPQASILNEKFTKPLGGKYGLTAQATCGTGPFILKEWVLNDHHTLVANRDYWRGKPQFDRFVVRIVPDPETMRMLFETGKLDVFDCDFARTQVGYFLNHPKWKKHIVKGPVVGTYYYTFNQNIEPFGDVRVRRAFQMSVDRQKMLDKLFYGQGQVENGVMPTGLIYHNPNPAKIPYDPAGAKKLLAEAGYPNGVDMQIAVMTSGSDIALLKKMSEIVQAMAAQGGFRVSLKLMDEAAYTATRKDGKLFTYTNKWLADFNDPDNYFYTLFSKRNSAIRSYNIKDPEIFRAVEQGRSLLDPTKRAKLYRDLEKKIVVDEAAWFPLYSLTHIYVTQPRVTAFVAPWNGWTDYPVYELRVK